MFKYTIKLLKLETIVYLRSLGDHADIHIGIEIKLNRKMAAVLQEIISSRIFSPSQSLIM